MTWAVVTFSDTCISISHWRLNEPPFKLTTIHQWAAFQIHHNPHDIYVMSIVYLKKCILLYIYYTLLYVYYTLLYIMIRLLYIIIRLLYIIIRLLYIIIHLHVEWNQIQSDVSSIMSFCQQVVSGDKAVLPTSWPLSCSSYSSCPWA